MKFFQKRGVAIVVLIVAVGLWFFDIIISWLVSTFNAWLG